MGQRIAIDRLGFTTVHGEIGLLVSIQIQFVKGDTAANRFLKNSRGYRPAMPLHLAGEAAIQRDQFHIATFFLKEPSAEPLAASSMSLQTASGAESTGK